jgi:hypothetical protein
MTDPFQKNCRNTETGENRITWIQIIVPRANNPYVFKSPNMGTETLSNVLQDTANWIFHVYYQTYSHNLHNFLPKNCVLNLWWIKYVDIIFQSVLHITSHHTEAGNITTV